MPDLKVNFAKEINEDKHSFKNWNSGFPDRMLLSYRKIAIVSKNGTENFHILFNEQKKEQIGN